MPDDLWDETISPLEGKCPYCGQEYDDNGTCNGVIHVSERDYEAILEAIENPPEPKEALKELFRPRTDPVF